MPVSPPFIAIETAMFFGLGFLLALLLMLAFMPAVHRRAVRLTRRKYEPVPLEQKEMHAEKDRLRADFAMSTRKLEHDIDHMQRKAAAHFTELARKAETIKQLKETLDTRDTLIAQLQEQNAQLAAAATPASREFQALKAENAAKTAALAQANERIAALMAEIAALTAALDKRIRVYDRQQHEIMALTSQSDVLRMELAALAGQAAQAPPPAFTPATNGQAQQDGENDVIRRALEAIEANGQGPMPYGFASAPSNGAVPFGH
jgi:chromosome segregation ATPase